VAIKLSPDLCQGVAGLVVGQGFLAEPQVAVSLVTPNVPSLSMTHALSGMVHTHQVVLLHVNGHAANIESGLVALVRIKRRAVAENLYPT
jgi:hypothetical protein